MVHWRSLISHYTCVGTYGNDAANVAQHIIFRGKPSFVDKMIKKKNRFGELSTEEKQETVDYAVPFTTKKTATNFGMRLFNDTYQLLFPLKLQNFKCDCRDLTHS